MATYNPSPKPSPPTPYRGLGGEFEGRGGGIPYKKFPRPSPQMTFTTRSIYFRASDRAMW